LSATLSHIVQALTILLGAVFGFVGTLSKREDGPLKRSDRVALWGISAAACMALASLAVDVAKKAAEREAELRRVSEEVSRQGKLLQEVQRGQRAISQFSLDVEFSVSAKHPALASLVENWERFLAKAKRSDFYKMGYSHDGSLFVARREDGKVHKLYVNPSSSLFPARLSSEFLLLLPTLSVALLDASAPLAETIAADLSLFPKKHTDLSLLAPLSLLNRKTAEKQPGLSKSESTVFATLIYDRKKASIQVSGQVSPATATTDTGAIVSLMDLPGRQLVLIGLKQSHISSIDAVKLTASTGTGRFWSGHKEIRGPALQTFFQGDKAFASYRLSSTDFTGLYALQPSTSASAPR